MTIRVVVADDQEVVRLGFAAVLDAQPDIEVVAAAADGIEAVALAAQMHPDVVVMDVRMPRLDGISATAQITESSDGATKVLVVTTFDLDAYVYEALRSGASGFLLKDARAQTLTDAVRTVAAGDSLLTPQIVQHLIAEFSARRTTPSGSLGVLTPREVEVLQLVARGQSNAEIAAALVIAEETVKTHVAHCLAKLQARDRVQLVVFAYESGLVNPGDP
jgi:DNA-binding NarL/FixJ family response regulator